MLALYHDDLVYLGDVPVFHLALAVVGVPLAAAAAGGSLPAVSRPRSPGR
jgi:hypothetical protein